MAAAYSLSLFPIPTSSLFSSSSSSSCSSSSPNLKKPISSSLSFLLPQTPKTPFLSIQRISFSRLSPIHTSRRPSSTIVFVLPTAKPDRAPADKIPKWSMSSIRSFTMAEIEARKLRHSTIGTEVLIMGILAEGSNEAAKFLRANGITLFTVREEAKLLVKPDRFYSLSDHPSLTEPAQRALDWAVDEKMKSGESGEVTPSHMLLGIWSDKESGGHKILATLGFDDEKASELAKNVNKELVMSERY